jgi:hypothetical protein
MKQLGDRKKTSIVVHLKRVNIYGRWAKVFHFME